MKKSILIQTKKNYSYVGKLQERRLAVGNKPNKAGEGLKYGFLDEKGKEIIPLKYDVVWDFEAGMSRTNIVKNKKPNWGIIDKDGNTILPNIYKMILPLDHNLFYVQTNEKGLELKWSVFDIISKEFIQPFIYDWLYPVYEEIIVYRIGKKYGAFHSNGKEIIPAKYDNLKFFSEGLCAAKLNGKWGYINKENDVIIPFAYKHVWPFEKGIAQVYRDSDYSMLELKNYKIK